MKSLRNMVCIIIGILVVGGMVVFAGVPINAAEKVTLRYWFPPSGDFVNRLQKEMVRKFCEIHPNVNVVPLIVSTENNYTKYLVAIAGGNPPDVIQFFSPEIPAWVGSLGALTPIDEYVKKAGIKEEDFIPAAWKACVYGGHVYALPLSVDVSGFLWNKDIFAEVGLDPEKPPKTIEELDKYAEKTTKYDSKGRFIRAGFVPWMAGFYLWGYIFGGSFYDPGTKTITANNPKNIKALEWILSYAKKYNVEKIEGFRKGFGSYATASAPFYVGRVAMREDGEWQPAFIQRYAPNLNYGVTWFPYPSGGIKHVAYIGGANPVAIPRGIKHLSEAFDLVKWITSPAMSKLWSSSVCNITSWKSVTKDPEYLGKAPPMFKVFNEIAREGLNFSPPSIPVASLLGNELGTAVEEVIRFRKGSKEVLDEVTVKAQREMDRVLKR